MEKRAREMRTASGVLSENNILPKRFDYSVNIMAPTMPNMHFNEHAKKVPRKRGSLK